MNRRQCLGVLGSAVASMFATWRIAPARVPLEKFCLPDSQTFPKWDCSGPFAQEQGSRLYAFATDARVALRVVDPAVGQSLGDKPPPPATILPWKHDQLRGWRQWPAENYLLAHDGECGVCNGHGTADGKCGHGCEACGGSWGGCKVCHGSGVVGPICPSCHGKAIGVFPHVQMLGDVPITAKYDRLIRANLRGLEWATVEHRVFTTKAVNTLVAFRFDGGLGLLATMDRANMRLVSA